LTPCIDVLFEVTP